MLFCSIGSAGEERSLREQKGLVGLPSVALLDEGGAVLVRVPFDERSVDGFRRGLARAERYVKLRAAAADGDVEAAAGFLLMQLEERQVTHADALRRRGEAAAADAAVLARIDQLVIDLGVSEQLAAAGQKGRAKLGPRFLAMLDDGPRPSAHVSRGFWFAILEWAEAERDVDAFAKGLAGFRAALAVTDPDAPWAPPLLERYQTKLDALRAGG